MNSDAGWYTEAENWHGSSLEMAIELGPADDARLLAAFRAAWASPVLTGPLDSPYPGRRPRELPEPPTDPEPFGHKTYGTIRLRSAERAIGCRITSLRDEVSDWLIIGIPTGMLELVYPVKYELSNEANPWILDVERDLVDVADRVFVQVPFDLAIYGENVSGFYYADSADEYQISREVIERGGGFLLSEGLWSRLAPRIEAKVLRSGLRWVPSIW